MRNKNESSISIQELRKLCDIEGYSLGDITDDFKENRRSVRGTWFAEKYSAVRIGIRNVVNYTFKLS